MKAFLSLACLLLFSAAVWGQTSESVLKNGIKTNLLGPSMMLRFGSVQFFWWYADLRYERKLPNVKFLSIVSELMFSRQPEFISVYDPNGNWIDFASSH